MPELSISWRQLGTLLFFGGFAWWALRWSGRNLRAQLGDQGSRPRISVLSSDEIEAIVSRQLATPVELFSMSAAEQRLLAQTAMSITTATLRAPTAEQAEARCWSSAGIRTAS